MDKEYELKYHRLEKDYWWFRARRDMIFKLLRKMNINSNYKILDLGCASGFLIEFLEKKGFKNISGIDISKEAIKKCRDKGLTNTFTLDCVDTKFKDREFDILIASDVLEHIENDDIALREWNRILKKNGILIVFVPAFNFLWSQHDEANYHYRRYSRKKLLDGLKKSNFSILRTSYWNFSLFIPISFIRMLERFKSKKYADNAGKEDQLSELPQIINKVLLYVLKIENSLLGKSLTYPYGLSVFAVGKKTY
jgi:SAM-dependent methyltransferase